MISERLGFARGIAQLALIACLVVPCNLAQTISGAQSKPSENCGSSTSAAPSPTHPNPLSAKERDILIALYKATDGQHWTHNSGWLGAPGTECDWYGVFCDDRVGSPFVLSLDLAQNNLAGTIPPDLGKLNGLTSLELSENKLEGTIPPELDQLTHLEWLSLVGNRLTGTIPEPLIQRWLSGPLSIAAEEPLLTTVSKIDYESNASSLLCGRQRIIFNSNDSATIYTTRCRNATPRDRTTYCEAKKGEVWPMQFARLAWMIERNGFFNLQSEYTRSITEGTFRETRVTRDGKPSEVHEYAGAGPLELWSIHRAIEGVAADIDFEKTSRIATCPRW